MPAPGSAPAATPFTPRWRGEPESFRILIVDDEPDIRASLQQALATSMAADILAVENAYVAQRILEASRCDVVLLDEMLPGLEGSALLQWMNQRKLLARTIIITALPAETLSTPPLLLGGAAAVFRKPIDFPQLLATIRAVAPAKRPGRFPVDKAVGLP